MNETPVLKFTRNENGARDWSASQRMFFASTEAMCSETLRKSELFVRFANRARATPAIAALSGSVRNKWNKNRLFFFNTNCVGPVERISLRADSDGKRRNSSRSRNSGPSPFVWGQSLLHQIACKRVRQVKHIPTRNRRVGWIRQRQIEHHGLEGLRRADPRQHGKSVRNTITGHERVRNPSRVTARFARVPAFQIPFDLLVENAAQTGPRKQVPVMIDFEGHELRWCNQENQRKQRQQQHGTW